MSKRFKTQDYFRYKKLGKRWRRPVGLQSKLRVKRSGSGMKVAVGHGSSHAVQPALIRNLKDFEKDCSAGALISSSVGSKKTLMLAAKAKELDITILNMKRVKRASQLQISLKKKNAKKNKAAEKKEEKAEKETPLNSKATSAAPEVKESEVPAASEPDQGKSLAKK